MPRFRNKAIENQPVSQSVSQRIASNQRKQEINNVYNDLQNKRAEMNSQDWLPCERACGLLFGSMGLPMLRLSTRLPIA